MQILIMLHFLQLFRKLVKNFNLMGCNFFLGLLEPRNFWAILTFNRYSSCQWYTPHWWKLSDLDQTWSGWTVHHPNIPRYEKNPLEPEGGHFGGLDFSIKGILRGWFQPWLSMNQKISWMAWRGGLKPLPNCTKSFWIRPFFDPPGLLKVF